MTTANNAKGITSTETVQFNGKYKQLMTSVYDGCIKLFGIPEDKAEKIARNAAADFGNAISAGNVTAKARIGSVTSNGGVTLSDTSSVKLTAITHPLSIARAIQWAGDAGKNGLSYKDTVWQLSEALQQYVDNLKVETAAPKNVVEVPA